MTADSLSYAANAAAGTLEKQLAFERALVEISARFAAVDADAVEEEIRRGLDTLLAFLDVDRSTFFEILEEGKLIAICSAAVAGVEPYLPGQEPGLPWYVRELLTGRAIAVTRLPDDLPPEAATEIEYVRRIGMRAHLGVPVLLEGRVRFIISAASFHESRGWSADVVARLKLVGEVFAQALSRARSEASLRRALAEVSTLKERIEAENAYLRAATAAPSDPDALPSHAPRFRKAVEEATQVARTRATVLLLGETGTGKELMAAYIHAASPRGDRTMIKLNCAALPANLIEAELFGRERGAYTGALTRQIGRFELAAGSTIFLDEVGELPLELQPKLLRVLQEGEFERVGGTQTIKVDVRVIAATNRALEEEVRAGRFREDLFYRLNVFPIALPPLRERAADIPMLAWQFVREFSQSVGTRVDQIGADTMARLQAYAWPGNIRELRNVIERAVILSRDSVLEVALPESAASHGPSPGSLAATERREIETTLQQCGWRIRGAGGAAARLGLKPTTLESRMQRLGIVRPR
jgi:transcriptional regulator with GAF, ATPase, and Fis domain